MVIVQVQPETNNVNINNNNNNNSNNDNNDVDMEVPLDQIGIDVVLRTQTPAAQFNISHNRFYGKSHTFHIKINNKNSQNKSNGKCKSLNCSN